HAPEGQWRRGLQLADRTAGQPDTRLHHRKGHAHPARRRIELEAIARYRRDDRIVTNSHNLIARSGEERERSRRGWRHIGAGRSKRLTAQCRKLADIVAKVENRISLKIWRKLIFGLLCRCVAFQRHYGSP